MSNKRIRLSLDVSPEMNNILEEMAHKIDSSKSEVLKRSIILMQVVLREKEKGYHLGIISDDKKIINEIIGL